MKAQTIKLKIYEDHYLESDIVDGEIDYQHRESYDIELELHEIMSLLQSGKDYGQYSMGINGWITLYDTNDGTCSSIEDGLIIEKDIFFADIERKAKHFVKLAKLANVRNLPDHTAYC